MNGSMNYMITANSDAGIKKGINQDALLIKVAQTSIGKVCLGVVCDGMGGLTKGELAGATIIRSMENWFETMFPAMLKRGFRSEDLKFQWDTMVLEQNQKLASYASKRSIRMGTTIVAVLLMQDRYYLMNVGDSRAYLVSDQLYQLTKDQTFVQRELDAGHITEEEAKYHPLRNVLLQCVGASEVVIPDFYEGQVYPDNVFILCSDGFRHIITSKEIYRYLNPSVLVNEKIMRDNVVFLTELNKQRREVDNISAVLIRTCREG